MALKIYLPNEETLAFDEVSAGTFEEAAIFRTVPGGTAMTKKLYLRNDDATKYYTSISLMPTATTGAGISSGAIAIKLLSGDSLPSEDEWTAAPANTLSKLISPNVDGNRRTLPDIGSVASPDTNYYPFWVRAFASRSTPIGEFQLSLSLTSTESTR